MPRPPRQCVCWAVISTRGSGDIIATASDRANAKLRAALVYTGDQNTDYERWWKTNASRLLLVAVQISVTVPTYRSVPYPDSWHPAEVPPAERCEWDVGHLLESQCSKRTAGTHEGHGLCHAHLRKAARDGVMRLVPRHDA